RVPAAMAPLACMPRSCWPASTKKPSERRPPSLQPHILYPNPPESTMRSKSLLTEAKQIDRAVTLINLGARLQVLESETDMSYERLLRLYKEVSGKSPSKGQLPFS